MRKKVMNPSFHGHAPGKDTLRAANAATERGLTGEKTHERATRSEGVCSPVLISLPVCHTVPTTLTVAVPGMTFHVPSAFCVYVAAGTTICPATVANAPVALS